MATLRAMTHAGCTQSLREDIRAGLIYGPYAEPTGETETCRTCHGTGSYAKYCACEPNDPAIWGTPAPCEFCRGTGKRPILRFLTMAAWAKITGLCVYCGTARRTHADA